MKILKLALVAILAIATLTSCKKNNDDSNITSGIIGRWEGKFNEDGESFYYRLDIKPNGIVEEYGQDGGKLGEGDWSLDPTTKIFMAYVDWSDGVAFSMMGAFNDAQHKMTGNWGYDNSTTDGGTWQLSKKN